MNNSELYHYGVLGMRWGVRKNKNKARLFERARSRVKQRRLDREKRELISDAKSVTAKAEPGKTRMVYGKYAQKRMGRAYLASHIVDEYGDVKLSYIRGLYGDRYIAAGKECVSKIDLGRYFHKTKDLDIEYDVYD